MLKKILFLFLFIFSVHGLAQGDTGSWTVTVTAGEFDRQNTVVTFLLPGQVDDGVYGMKMKDSSDHTVYVQVEDNRAHFILEELLNSGGRMTTAAVSWRIRSPCQVRARCFPDSGQSTGMSTFRPLNL